MTAQAFPRKVFKGLGGTQISIGLVCFLLAFIEIGYTLNSDFCWYLNGDGDSHWENDRDYENVMSDSDGFRPREDHDWLQHVRNKRQVTEGDFCVAMYAVYLYGAAFYIICGILFVVTGALGVGAARTLTAHRQSGLKTGYIVMNILNAISFGLVVFVVGIAVSVTTRLAFSKDDLWGTHIVTGGIAALMGLVQWIISIVAASVSCCCAPVVDEIKVISVPQPMVYGVQGGDKVGLIQNELLPDSTA